jgi:hypothetical protein
MDYKLSQLPLAFPYLFIRGISAPAGRAPAPAALVAHLLTHANRRFHAPEFVLWANNVLLRQKVSGIAHSASGTSYAATTAGQVVRATTCAEDARAQELLRVAATMQHTAAPAQLGGGTHEASSRPDCSTSGGHDADNTASAGYAFLRQVEPMFKSAPGLPMYIKTWRAKLFAALAQWRPPTWFFTAAPADMHWPELFAFITRTSMQEAASLSIQERKQLLHANPVLAARAFWWRWLDFKRIVLDGPATPLGLITQHFTKVEWQQRGSPHVHSILWTPAGDELRPSQGDVLAGPLCTQLCEYLDAHASAWVHTSPSTYHAAGYDDDGWCDECQLARWSCRHDARRPPPPVVAQFRDLAVPEVAMEHMADDVPDHPCTESCCPHEYENEVEECEDMYRLLRACQCHVTPTRVQPAD